MKVAYVHLLRFPLQRKLLETPSLGGQPVALWSETQGVRRIAFASARAQRSGVRSGMTLTAATALEPALVPFPFEPAAENRALVSLGESLMLVSPRFQLAAPEGLWLDTSGAHLFGGPEGLCERVVKLCQEQGYQARLAWAEGLFAARALARHGVFEAKATALCIEPSRTPDAVGRLPLRALEPLIDVGIRNQLQSLGLQTLGEVAGLPVGAWVARFGSEGLKLHRLCRGEDDTPLVPSELPEVLEERVELDWPAEFQEPLAFALKTVLDRLCGRLVGRKRCAVKVSFVLGLDSRETVAVPLTLARPTSQAKMLLELARHRLADLTLQSPVCAVGARVDEACDDPGQQLGLGDAPDAEVPLEVVLSKLSSTLGEDALFSAGMADRHLPEAGYAKEPFRPPAKARGMLAQLRSSADEARHEANAQQVAGASVERERPSRLFSRPASLDAELDTQGELRAARLLGKRRRVTALAGPERLAGDWWEAAFARDYYRVHFEGVGATWIFRDERDGRFYLQGMFD